MNDLTPIVVGLTGAVGVPLVTWVVARRGRSGRIDTSEAADLWAESQAMRQELRDEVSRLRADLAACQAHLRRIDDERR